MLRFFILLSFVYTTMPSFRTLLAPSLCATKFLLIFPAVIDSAKATVKLLSFNNLYAI